MWIPARSLTKRRLTGIPKTSQTPNPPRGYATLKRSPRPQYSPPGTTASTTAPQGWHPGTWFARRAGLVDPSTGEAVDLDDEARQHADAERAEADKRERRKVLALNKLGDAALSVRPRFRQEAVGAQVSPQGCGHVHR